MPSTTKIIEVDRDQSVQQLPDTKNGSAPHQQLRIGSTTRGPLLPARGTRQRERALRDYYWNDYNTAFRAAIAGLSKRVMSTPWELTGPEDMSEYFQFVFMQSDFGRGWESFVGKVLLDYSRYDGGAYIELIGSGDPLEPLLGPVTGLAVLDSLRCWPTGDPLFPVIYYDIQGKMHVLNHTRVVRFVDMLDPSEWAYGYGECSLSRCIAPVTREILMNRYIEQTLDDNPPPGIMTFQNLATNQLESAVQKMMLDRQTDFGGTWGHIIQLFGLQTEQPIKVESIPFTSVPEKFDFDSYKTLNMKELALGIGLDIQDLWELTGGNIGSATQSEILHQKSKGKALGRILKGFERVINLVLPPVVEFEFQYRDPDEDMQIAAKDQVSIANVSQLVASGLLTQDEGRQFLVNQVEAVRDVATDQSGVMIRLDDADPKAAGQNDPAKAPERATGEESQTGTDDAVVGDTETKSKDYTTTKSDFERSFIQIVNAIQDGTIPPTSAEMALRGQLQQAGERVWIDGLREGGDPSPDIDDQARKAISAWRAQQNTFIQQFVVKLFDTATTPEQAATRATMWVNKSLNNLYHAALGAADDSQLWMWVVNPLKEHCSTCLRMNGQVHTMKDYLKTGIVPQSSALECGGYRCGCELVKATGAQARGRIPEGQGSGGLRALFGRIAGAFRRLVGG